MKHMLSLMDWSQEELLEVLKLSEEMRDKHTHDLKGKTATMLFEKPSTRTRVSFEVGIAHMSGHPMYMDATTSQMSRGESTKDMALVMNRYVDMFVARVNSHKFLVEFAKWSKMPVINALSDLFHPCQALADVLTMKRKKGDDKLVVSFVGDGDNNVTHSLMLASSLLGYEMRVGCPDKFRPNASVIAKCKQNHQKYGGELTITTDPIEAVRETDVVYADVWVSMGRDDTDERLKIFEKYQINSELVKNAKQDYVFMHCLPAHIGQEVTEDIIYSKQSVVFDQAENRLHAQKGLMKFLLSEKQI